MKTMKQALMQLLLKQWVTPYIALQKVGCMSLSQRCGEFSREHEDWFWSMDQFSKPQPPAIISRWRKLPNGKRVKEYHAYRSNKLLPFHRAA